MHKTLFLLSMMMLSACGDDHGLRLSPLVTDHMVVQRGLEIPVYGWASPGSKVSVQFDGQSYRSKADASGRWEVLMPAREAGGPYTLLVASGPDSVSVEDILIGDVWLASGQSNMELHVSDANDAASVIRAASDSQIRHFQVPRGWAFSPVDTLAGGNWQVASPETVGGFSAVGYFFAQHLRSEIGVPIGILHSSWGGSRIEPWMKAEALEMGSLEIAAIEAEEDQRAEVLLSRLKERIGELPESDPGLVDGTAFWAAPGLDESEWTDIPVPSRWEEVGYEGMDGIGWYRTTFNLSAEESSRELVLGVGMIDDSDITWVNGVEVGQMEMSWNKARRYMVPSSTLKEGANTIAVRVFDAGGGGGISGDPALVYIEYGGDRHSLAGDWKFKVGEISVTVDGGKNQIATLLYNSMIHPLVDTPIKGAIWYQGESNANSLEDATDYSALFKTMITSWRQDWDQGDFPFLWVQLANFMAADSQPQRESNWAKLRESQTDALELSATGEAIIIDIGDADDIHPTNKQDVGLRLALAARRVAYDQEVVFSGPKYRSHEVQGSRIVVSFDHVGTGLVGSRNGKVGGFAIAGADGEFVWADARIDGLTVVVASSSIREPNAVRYAWADNPDKANLYNNERLPAVPFRTDRD